MSADANHATRLVGVTAANLRQNHIYLNGTAGFFPTDCLGPPSKREELGKLLQLDLPGFGETRAY